MLQSVSKSIAKIVGKKAVPYVFAGLSLAIVYFIYTYSSKSFRPMMADGFENAEKKEEGFSTKNASPAPAPVSSSGVPQPIVDPSELMPKDTNSEWARMNPHSSSDLTAITSLDAGYHLGMTQNTALRNPNLQLRSEVPNPRVYTGPWNQSTIEGDPYRRELEIGSTPGAL
jgi:hypothetical protein